MDPADTELANAECQVVADAIAVAVGGTVRVVPTDYSAARAVVFPQGGTPVLVVGYVRLVRVNVSTKSWHWVPGEPLDLVAAVAATATAWVTTNPERVSLIELSLDLADTLGQTFGDAWDISIPGTVDPSEMWLHGSSRNAASVGVFNQRVVVWVDGKSRSTDVGSRGALPSVRSTVVAAVKAQHAFYQRNLVLSEQINAIAGALVSGLGQSSAAPQGSYRNATRGTTLHDSVVVSTIIWEYGGVSRNVAHVTSDDGRVHIHAGLEGKLGWERTLDGTEVLAELVEHIAAAFMLELTTLTIDRLCVGQRYRVLESIGDLVAGTVVTFAYFDDIDNHYGRYEFTDESGKTVSVGGDFSTPRNSPLGETHRYLAEVKS